MSDTLYKIAIPTKSHTQMLLITREVEHIVEKSGVKSGICVVFSPYSTSCVTINENADPSVRTDIMKTMDNRYVMNTDKMKALGIKVEEPDYV